MFSKFLFAIAGLILLVGSLVAVKAAQIKEMSSMDHSMPPASVTTIEAQAAKWPRTITAIGTLAPVNGAMISAEADGVIVRIAVESGAKVNAGDLLAEIDTSVELAQLKSAEARAEWSRITLNRSRELRSRDTISQAEVDAAEAAEKQAAADVTSLKAVIAKKQIRAPFTGRVGIRVVNLGEFVARGAPLMPLQTLDPIFVNFNVPQRQLPALAVDQTVAVRVDAFEKTFDAKITAINSEVDPQTRNISVQATLPNPDEQLRAGMFARAEIQLPTGDDLVVVPATAISYASYGNSVFIVEKMKAEDGKEYLGVRQQFVKLGATRGDMIAVTGGLKPGEQVVTAGVFKLRNGVPVQVNNTVQPTSNPEPTPKNT